MKSCYSRLGGLRGVMAGDPVAMDRPYLVRHQFLQPPQIAVMDAEGLEMADGVVEIFRTRADVAAHARQHPRDLLQRLPERRAPAGDADPEAQRPQPALRRVHRNPPDGGNGFVIVDLASQ